MVNMSSSACVGCAWRPSPALMTWISGATCLAMKCAAPLCAWRTTNMSACIAHRLSTVSSRVSPLLVEDEPMLRLTTSADRRLAAISKVVRVRVLFSKNTLNTDLPCSSGTFLISWPSAASRKVAARSRMSRTICTGKPSVVSKCWSSPFYWVADSSYDQPRCGFIKISLQYLLRGILVDQFFLLPAVDALFVQLRAGGERSITLMDQYRRQIKPPLEAVGEAAAQGGQFVRRPVFIAGQTHHQRARLPFRQQGRNSGKARIGFFFIDGGQRIGLAQQRTAGRDADAPGAEIKCEERSGRRTERCRYAVFSVFCQRSVCPLPSDVRHARHFQPAKRSPRRATPSPPARAPPVADQTG